MVQSKKILNETEDKFGLVNGVLRKATIKQRVLRKNLTGKAHQRTSPIAAAEPIIADYCIRLANMGAPLFCDQVMSLANSIISGTSFMDDLIKFKTKRNLLQPDSTSSSGTSTSTLTSVVGIAWYRGFMKRYNDKIVSKRGRVKDIKRHTWCVYDTFEAMYKHVYDCMVESKVAVKVDIPLMYDVNGNEVSDKDLAYGIPTEFKITHPRNIIFVDETGKNTNMKEDKRVGGKRYIVPANSIGNSCGYLGSTTDIHFTVLCFTSALGEPVMCAIILKSEKNVSDLPLTWKFGLDITKEKLTGESEAHEFILNYGEGKSMPGGPRCLFNSKEIPCYVGSSPKASITSTMLADMLKTMDSFNIFDRSNGKKPFILLDGHHSRFEMPFLDYIIHPDHEWTVCIGVPYGTHLWQVGDSEAQNGSFSMAISKAKEELFRYKPQNNKNFCSSDIIPLVNAAWPKSFGRTESTRRAIVERGWNPLNYSLLLHPEILKTKALVASTTNKENTDCNQQQGSGTSTTVNAGNITTSGSILSLLNTSEGTAGGMVDLLVLQEMKNRGRTEAILKRREKQEVRHNSIKALANGSGKLTSGMLGVNEHYCLDSDVRDAVSSYYEKKKEEERKKKERQQLQTKARNEKYEIAKQKYVNNQPLNRVELTSLLSYHRQKDDPPLAKTMGELRQQWETRKRRMGIFISIESSLSIDRNNTFLIDSDARTPPSVLDTNIRTNSTNSAKEQTNHASASTSTYINNSTCTRTLSDPNVEDYFLFDDAQNIESGQL